VLIIVQAALRRMKIPGLFKKREEMVIKEGYIEGALLLHLFWCAFGAVALAAYCFPRGRVGPLPNNNISSSAALSHPLNEVLKDAHPISKRFVAAALGASCAEFVSPDIIIDSLLTAYNTRLKIRHAKSKQRFHARILRLRISKPSTSVYERQL
jgi:hypothetical protein